jgi:hypothetical protein
MLRRSLLVLTLTLAAVACGERDLPTTTAPAAPVAGGPAPAQAARERLAQRLAVALGDPTVRAAFARRLDASNAPEGKLQFQALARADQGALLAALTTHGSASTADLLADLDAARALEVYLPVEAHRTAWHGGANFLVATAAKDGDTPVAFDATGHRSLLDPRTPPATPVLALVPQETDFTGGRPELMLSCVDVCSGTGSGGSGSTSPSGATVTGLFVVQSHFDDDYESWLKGKPEFEYHVYGVGDGGASEQLACTGEKSGGPYYFDQNNLDWTGTAMLLSDGERAAYEQQHPGAPIRIVAYEDDDEACVPRLDGTRLAQALAAVDAAYQNYTSGKLLPWYIRGIKAAPSIFNLLGSVYSLITTGDDLIGNGVEASIAGSAPGGANFLIKNDGTRTTGWFTTEYH